jgi:hypothetical protein
MRPFDPTQDGFPFSNAFGLTADNVVELVQMFGGEVVEAVTPKIVRRYTGVLSALSFDIPIPFLPDPTVGVPDFVIDQVGAVVGAKLVAEIIDLHTSPLSGAYGRCGGMAFAGYDFYRQGWSVTDFGSTPPTEGVLGDYIFARLIDSLDLNGRKFLEWLIELHFLPKLNGVADAAFGAAVGSIGGPVGTVIGAFIASKGNIFHFGGAGELLSSTKVEWVKLKERLDEEAAWPIGLIYGDEASPLEQHQVLAIGYTDNGLGEGTLDIWDNNDGPKVRKLIIDFRGSKLKVKKARAHTIRGIFVEDYIPQKPPRGLRRLKASDTWLAPALHPMMASDTWLEPALHTMMGHAARG